MNNKVLPAPGFLLASQTLPLESNKTKTYQSLIMQPVQSHLPENTGISWRIYQQKIIVFHLFLEISSGNMLLHFATTILHHVAMGEMISNSFMPMNCL